MTMSTCTISLQSHRTGASAAETWRRHWLRRMPFRGQAVQQTGGGEVRRRRRQSQKGATHPAQTARDRQGHRGRGSSARPAHEARSQDDAVLGEARGNSPKDGPRRRRRLLPAHPGSSATMPTLLYSRYTSSMCPRTDLSRAQHHVFCRRR